VDQDDINERPWRLPESHDRELKGRLPGVVLLSPDYSVRLPIWSEEDAGQISWRTTNFSPELLDRLADWQSEFDENYHWEKGWTSEHALIQWAHEATDLIADLRIALGGQAELVVDLWPLKGTRYYPAQGSLGAEQRQNSEQPPE
jgi:hypothetical protein